MDVIQFFSYMDENQNTPKLQERKSYLSLLKNLKLA